MTAKDPVLIISQQGKIINSLLSYGNGKNSNHGLSWQILPLLFVKIAVNPKGLTAFCALIKTKSAHDKLQSIKKAWSKDEICCLEIAALPAQCNSESDKYRFNTAFLTGSDYYRYPKPVITPFRGRAKHRLNRWS